MAVICPNRIQNRGRPTVGIPVVSVAPNAAQLSVSRQTVYRQLKAEGVTFETVLDELRHKVAVPYLSGAKTSVNDTAYMVGFSEPAAFSRAFKRWTVTTPRSLLAVSGKARRT